MSASETLKVPPKDRTEHEIKLTEQLLEENIQKTRAERVKAEAETRLVGFEVLEYERQERNAKAKHSEARIYHFYGAVDQNSVKAAISTLHEWVRREPGEEITIVFNSPGGGVFPGMALYDAIKEIRAGGTKVTTVTRGYAASMGGILFQAGDKRIIGENSYVLIHEISSVMAGTQSEMEDEVKLTKRLQDRLLGILVERSTLTKKEIERKWKRQDWWLDSAECVEFGFADEIG